MEQLLDVVFRSVSVYIFMIIALRLMGKKELSQLNTSDLILVLLISNAVQNAMVGPDTSLIGGLTAAASLFLVNYVLKLLLFNNRKLRNVLEGNPTLLVYKGEVNHANLEKEKISISELEAAIREHGLSNFDEVALSMLERDGNISVISDNLGHQHIYRRKKGLAQKIRNKK